MNYTIFKNRTLTAVLAVFALGVFASGCDKMIDTRPENELLVEDAVKTSADLQKLLNGSYNEVANTYGGFAQVISEFMADNLSLPNNNDYREVFNHNTLFFNTTCGSLYGNLYRAIFRANFVMESFPLAADLNETDRNRMEGEAKFIRAMCHFTAVRLFAHPWGYSADNSHPGIGLALKADRTPLARSSVAAAYASIISDLKDAATLLPESNGNYATKYAAQALLAEVYFQQGAYSDAGTQASAVISSARYTFSDTLNRFTPKGASEAIFSVVSTGINDNRGGGFRDNYSPGLPLCQVSRQFFSTVNTDTADKRLAYFVTLNKGQANELVKTNLYNAPLFDVPVLHLTRLHLIRAEALAKTGTDLSTAIADMNAIIGRAYKNNNRILAAGSTATQIIEAARYQRRMELMFEGDRIHDLKRLAAVEKQNIIVRGHSWDCRGFILQFPISDQTSIFPLNPTGGCD